jgi:hypothetical protein
VSTHGSTGASTMAITPKTKKMAKVLSTGPMDANTTACGKMVASTEKAPSSPCKESSKKEFGRMARGSVGSTSKLAESDTQTKLFTVTPHSQLI